MINFDRLVVEPIPCWNSQTSVCKKLKIGACDRSSYFGGSGREAVGKLIPLRSPFGHGGSRGRDGVAPALFMPLNVNKRGSAAREEVQSVFDACFTTRDTGALTRERLVAGLSTVLPSPPAGLGGAGTPQNQTQNPADVESLLTAPLDTALATPNQPRRVLVYVDAADFVHRLVPTHAKTTEAPGASAGAWTTVIPYHPSDINVRKIRQFDAAFPDKVSDPGSQTTPDFKRRDFEITCETNATQRGYSRENAQLLMTIDVSKMTPADLAEESRPVNHDQALSGIRAEGEGRVFYRGMKPMLGHTQAGIPYLVHDNPDAEKVSQTGEEWG